MTEVFQELAEYRRQLGLPSAGSESDRATVAKLEMGESEFFGISSGSNPYRRRITLTVNPISRHTLRLMLYNKPLMQGLKAALGV